MNPPTLLQPPPIPEEPPVLLLEDDAVLATVLQEALGGEGWQVVRHNSFAELLRQAEQSAASVVVADFWGESHDKLSDAERKEVERLGAVARVVLVTGRSWVRSVRPVELGVHHILEKPYDLVDLLKILDSLRPTSIRESESI